MRKELKSYFEIRRVLFDVHKVLWGGGGGKKENLVSLWEGVATALWDESTVDHKPGIIYPALFALQIIMPPTFQEYKFGSKKNGHIQQNCVKHWNTKT